MLPFVLALVGSAAPPVDASAVEPDETTDAPRPNAPKAEPDVPVVGGTPAPAGRWADAVALYAGGVFACTGVLVAPDVVLTAGHCQFALETAVVGTVDLRSGGETVPVRDVVGHEDYTSTFDVAVVRLDREVATPPRPLALDCVAEDYVYDGAGVTIVGFGATDLYASEWTDTLQEAPTSIVDADCSDLTAGCYSAVSPGGEVRAGGDGVDSCAGDSGGPLYLDTPEGAFLLGITSRAAVPATTPCGDGGIYVRADAVADWIEATTGRALERPSCEGWNHPPRPTAEPIDVEVGRQGATRVDPGDPDEGQDHTFEVIVPPEHGSVELRAEGVLVYTGLIGWSGEDRVVVEVIDDGEPALAAEVEVPVSVARPPPFEPRGCTTTPGSATVTVLVGLALLRRRPG